jgi:hypothetical protein
VVEHGDVLDQPHRLVEVDQHADTVIGTRVVTAANADATSSGLGR